MLSVECTRCSVRCTVQCGVMLGAKCPGVRQPWAHFPHTQAVGRADVVQCSALHCFVCNAVQCSVVQFSAVTAVQCSAVKFSAEWSAFHCSVV